jgi:glutathione S-transferase
MDPVYPSSREVEVAVCLAFTQFINCVTELRQNPHSGLKPNPPGSWSEYSVPTVRFPDGAYVMDSAAIAGELEARYPAPSLKLNSDLENEAQAAMSAVFMPLVPFLLMFAKNLVAPEDLDWFKADRAQRFGMTVEQAFETERDPAPILEAAKPGFEKCRNVLRVHKVDKGPYILGSEPCYADFYLVASTQMFNRAGERCWTEFSKAAPAELIELHDACRKWTARQD